jgi:hypothetical protein
MRGVGSCIMAIERDLLVVGRRGASQNRSCAFGETRHCRRGLPKQSKEYEISALYLPISLCHPSLAVVCHDTRHKNTQILPKIKKNRKTCVRSKLRKFWFIKGCFHLHCCGNVCVCMQKYLPSQSISQIQCSNPMLKFNANLVRKGMGMYNSSLSKTKE